MTEAPRREEIEMTDEDRAPEAAPDAADRLKDLGQEAREAGHRLASEPRVVRAADTATRAWGAILIAIGLWFLAGVTFGVDLPSISWRDAWPVLLVVVGLVIITTGLTRRRG
jgi:hypothetical protein